MYIKYPVFIWKSVIKSILQSVSREMSLLKLNHAYKKNYKKMLSILKTFYRTFQIFKNVYYNKLCQFKDCAKNADIFKIQTAQLVLIVVTCRELS